MFSELSNILLMIKVKKHIIEIGCFELIKYQCWENKECLCYKWDPLIQHLFCPAFDHTWYSEFGYVDAGRIAF